MIASPHDEARQQLEEAARQIVESVRRALDASHEETPTRREEFTDRDLAYYEHTARELEALGFRLLGAYEIAAKRWGPLADRRFGEYALGDGDRVIANWFALPTRNGPQESLVFQTFASDGRVLSTARGMTDVGLPHPPERSLAIVAADTSTPALLEAHRGRVADHASPARPFATIHDILAARQEHALRTAEYRRALGIGVYESVLRKRFGDDPKRIGAALLAVIRAHPEWHEPSRH